MLSKKDYRNYLKEIEDVEKIMRDIYGECLERIEDDKIRRVCVKLLEDEKRHVTMINEMVELIGL